MDKKFNQKYLSDYFSALVSSGNQKNKEALEYFNSSKFLIQKHDEFLKKYVFSLVLNGQVKKGIDQIKTSKNDINSNTFELNLLLLIDSLKKNDFKKCYGAEAVEMIKILKEKIDPMRYLNRGNLIN